MIPLGVRLNNPGNIRYNGIPWQRLANPPSERGYCRFLDAEHGLRAMMVILKNYDLHTISDIVHRYAPPGDNNPVENYITYVSKDCGFGPSENIDMKNRQFAIPVIQSMCRFEQGAKFITFTQDDYNRAADIAGLS